MASLILMRHGQSMWNAANLFTGWVDVPLTQTGIDEALAGGRTLADIRIDEVHTSTLIRAQMTAMLALSQHNSGKTPVIQYVDSGETMSENEGKMVAWSQLNQDADDSNILPVYVSWQLNERMYGDLQGMNKQETRAHIFLATRPITEYSGSIPLEKKKDRLGPNLLISIPLDR